MKHHRIRRLPAAIAAVAVLLTTAAVAFGATGATPTTITLGLQGGYRNVNMTVCKNLHHYTLYHQKTKLIMNGTVDPTPPFPDGAWKVKIKIKKCVLGKWKVIAQPHVLGNQTLVNGVKTAVYKYTRPLGINTGFFFARAYYYTTPTTSIISTDEHFRVTK